MVINMAASMKFTYCLLILFSSLRLFTAHPLHEDEIATTEITTVFKTYKKMTSDTVNTSNNKIRGRKMAMRLARAREQEVTTESRSKVSVGSNQVVEGNLDTQQKWGPNKEDCEQQSTSGRFSAVRLDKEAGFVAFSADYTEPRHHPPKNN